MHMEAEQVEEMTQDFIATGHVPLQLSPTGWSYTPARALGWLPPPSRCCQPNSALIGTMTVTLAVSFFLSLGSFFFFFPSFGHIEYVLLSVCMQKMSTSLMRLESNRNAPRGFIVCFVS